MSGIQGCNYLNIGNDISEHSDIISSMSLFIFHKCDKHLGVVTANDCTGFLCYSGKCLNPRLQDDFLSDCPGLAQEDEYDRNKRK